MRSTSFSIVIVIAMMTMAPTASSTDAYLLTLEEERELLYSFRAERSYQFEPGICNKEYLGGRRRRQLLQQDDSGIGGLAMWSVVAPISAWDGLEFHGDGHVSDIMLACFDITGSLPTAWSKLDLESIELPGNSMFGDLPRGWDKFPNLTSLDLSGNRFRDKLPEEWSSLTSLKQMSLAENKLSGGLPQAWSSLANLEELNLGGNPEIGGNLPLSWQHLSSIRSLDLRSSGLTGQVPLVWTKLENLQALRLGGNLLSGALEPSWKAFANMSEIDLSNNQLTGTLPREWSMLSSLSSIDLGGNMLYGTIPEEWSVLSGLRRLRLSGNKLSGEVPKFVSVLTNLMEIDLSNNSFTGFLPNEWSTLSMAEEIQLSRNKLIGALPVPWQILQLRYLDVSNNYMFNLVSLTIMAADEIEFDPQLPTSQLMPPPPPSPALPPSPPPSPYPPPPFPPLPSNVYSFTNGACGKDRIQAELEAGNFDECLQLGADVSSSWQLSTIKRCCKVLATLQEDQCLCDEQFFLTRVENFTEATAHTIHNVAKAACGMPLDCIRRPPPPPPSPPPRPPMPPPPPLPPSPPPPFMTAVPTPAPSAAPTMQPTIAPTPAPSPVSTLSPTPQPTPVPTTLGSSEETLRKDFQALVLFTSASDLFRAPADLTQEELSLLRTAVSNALPVLEERDVEVLGANRTGTDAVVFELSVTLRSRGNVNLEEVWSGFQSDMLRRGLTEAGITDVVWVSLTGDGYFDIGGSQSKGDFPTASFLMALGTLLATVLGCCALDVLRSRVSCCGAELCSNPQHLELLLPALALLSVVATAAYAAAELSDGLLYMALGAIAATVVFNMIGLYYFYNSTIDDDDDDTAVLVHAVSAICAVIHVGTLKLPTCNVASWCSMPITQQRYNSLALLGLASSFLGSAPIMAVVITNQQDEWEWSSLALFTFFASLGVLLVCAVAVLRCFIMPVSGRASDRTRPYSQLEISDADNTSVLLGTKTESSPSSPNELLSIGDGAIPAARKADQQDIVVVDTTTASEAAVVKGDAMDDEEAALMKSPFEPMPYKS